MILPILTGIYLVVGCFAMFVIDKNNCYGLTIWRIFAIIFGWLPILIYSYIEKKIKGE